MKRRKLLTAASLATAGMLLPLGWNTWVVQGKAQAANSKRLVVIFLRGGIDGLNIVIPHQEPDYYQARPTIAIPYPQEANGAIDLDGFFGLHPELEDLISFWRQKNLAFVHTSGSPVVERSHFQAQDYIENGTPGIHSTKDGWMNRLLAELPQEYATKALNVGVTTPYILRGKMQIANLKPGLNSTAKIATDNPQINKAFSSLYSGTDDLSKAYQDGHKTRESIVAELGQDMIASARGAKGVNAFADDAVEVTKLMLGNAKTQLVFMEVAGWDTHVNQSNTLNRLLPSFSQGLTTLVKGLEPIWSDTVVAVVSEFGRTFAENGNRGTDHGYGNVMWLLGGGIRGGKVYGEWQGLDESALHQNRDLPVTTDFREIFYQILQSHLSLPVASLNRVFPDYQLTNKIDFLA
jgi:uncharacterized protein (DUF1501 family)